ncbi:HlyD family secretion protein [Bacteroides caecicola]|uniref:HlyD family secretion protein n=1 Tax=Bacteroides caecicola TaxID=1462569 RepID=A0ABS2F5C7_9BACE|nr:HlyD family secretion protein [Bacteroides caecicola]MBM6804989.1 HlyD family secretion protein [Bacteroides caecicola]
METTTNTRKQESGKVFTMKKAVGIIGICLAIWGLYAIISLFVDYKSSETTDDAQVEQYLSPVNIRVAGYIKKIYFTEHQHVRKGDTLLVLEDDEYRIRLKEAEAALMDARSGRKVVANTLNTVSNSASVYDASIAEAQYRMEQLEKDYRRYSSLLKKNATTPIVVEQYQTQLEMARARVAALKQQREAAHSSVTEVDQRQENAEAAVKRAEAAVDLAALNLSYTVVTAPCNGCLGRRSIEEGQLVNAGQTLTTIIPDTRKWVVANYKETQISSLAVGQEVEVTVDAFAGKTFKGRITAISSATGSKYSMVPTDNSAGNFVKIQQRVPVRIELTDISDEDNARLAAGMMCVVKANL